MKNTSNDQHVFETAGLGLAPFRFIGAIEDRGPHKVVINGVQCEVGAPGQPMGTCAYCGQGIAICCRIESADGKRFTVGSDCVAKTGDKGLKALVRKEATKRTKVREEARVDELRYRLVNDLELIASLEARPHPQGFKNRETGEDLSLLDQVTWMMANSGLSGRMRMVRSIAKMEKK
tara:strand:- start:57003 stop:57533 length:531 start_codon:yes stop_codon:yes gene_type:complete